MRKGKKEITWTHERHVRLRRWCMGVCRRIASVALSNAAVSFFFVRDFLFPISRCATGEWLHIFFWNYYYFFLNFATLHLLHCGILFFIFRWFSVVVHRGRFLPPGSHPHSPCFLAPYDFRPFDIFIAAWLPIHLLHRGMCFGFFFLVRITWISVMVQKLYWFHYHISLIFLFFERYFICLHCGTFHHLFSAVLVKWESAASISGTQCPRFSLIIQNRQMTVCVCVCFRKTFHLLNSGNECADPLPWFSPLIQNREEEWLI